MAKKTTSHRLFSIGVKVTHLGAPPYHTYVVQVRDNAGTEEFPNRLLARFCRKASEAFAEMAQQYETDTAPTTEGSGRPSQG